LLLIVGIVIFSNLGEKDLRAEKASIFQGRGKRGTLFVKNVKNLWKGDCGLEGIHVKSEGGKRKGNRKEKMR